MKTLNQRVFEVLEETPRRTGVAVLDGKDGFKKLAHRPPIGDGGFVVTVLDPPDPSSPPPQGASKADPAPLNGNAQTPSPTAQTAHGGLGT